MANADVPTYLLAVYKVTEKGTDLKQKTFDALKNILFVCNSLGDIEHLVSVCPLCLLPLTPSQQTETPLEILEFVLTQFAKSLNQDQGAKK